MKKRPTLSRRGALMRRPTGERAGSGRLEMRLFRLGGRDRRKPASSGGAPGGAGPYVTGAARPGRRARWLAHDARAGPFAKDLPREPRKLPWVLANPWRLPALHHPFEGTENR